MDFPHEWVTEVERPAVECLWRDPYVLEFVQIIQKLSVCGTLQKIREITCKPTSTARKLLVHVVDGISFKTCPVDVGGDIE